MIEIKYTINVNNHFSTHVRVKDIFAIDTENNKIYFKKKSDLLSCSGVTNIDYILTIINNQ